MTRFGTLFGLVAAVLTLSAATARGQTPVPDSENYQYDYDRVKIDRYLDAEVWTDHSDQEYYSGDKIVVYFRASRDCFVSIYSIDTRGRVDLLFPANQGDDNFIYGGVTYRIPGENDNYDLKVTGPEGFEHVQIVASRERFDIPNWYHNSGLVCDAQDVDEYMDYLNTNYFVRYGGQRFAYDRASFYVNEWEPDYFRPVYAPYYPSWAVYGNCYIDYPWGSSVYINGVYWGCTPLFIPRLVVGWHTITVYDHYHHCWESDFHVSRYNTIVFNKTEIHPKADVKSKYKEVQAVGYRNPVTNGYPNFEARKTEITKELARTNAPGATITKTTHGSVPSGGVISDDNFSFPKNFVRGSTKVIKTDRGYETDATGAVISTKGGTYRKATETGRVDGSGEPIGFHEWIKATGRSGGEAPSGATSKGNSATERSGTYRKISGSNAGKAKGAGTVTKGPTSSGKSGGTVGKKEPNKGSMMGGSSAKKQGGGSSSSGKSNSGGNSRPHGKSTSGGNAKPAQGDKSSGHSSGGSKPPVKSSGLSHGGGKHPR